MLVGSDEVLLEKASMEMLVGVLTTVERSQNDSDGDSYTVVLIIRVALLQSESRMCAAADATVFDFELEMNRPLFCTNGLFIFLLPYDMIILRCVLLIPKLRIIFSLFHGMCTR